ncbi:MAG TPA: hypothetical protein VHZ03_05505 [Trebonia sp.]|nr:hypothetical protein [Trebonia sp.]
MTRSALPGNGLGGYAGPQPLGDQAGGGLGGVWQEQPGARHREVLIERAVTVWGYVDAPCSTGCARNCWPRSRTRTGRPGSGSLKDQRDRTLVLLAVTWETIAGDVQSSSGDSPDHNG